MSTTDPAEVERSLQALSLGREQRNDDDGSSRRGGSPAGHSDRVTTPPANKLDTPRRRGVVKFFNSLKGFGFVVDNDPSALGGQEVFCHFSAITGKGGFRSLAEASAFHGEEVEYELVQGPKGFQAANLTGPGGRNVVGDPKVRLAKPMQYMPFAPLGMMPASYLADPYIQQPVMFSGGQIEQQALMYMPTPAMTSYGGPAYPRPQNGQNGQPPREPKGAGNDAMPPPFRGPQNPSRTRYGPSSASDATSSSYPSSGQSASFLYPSTRGTGQASSPSSSSYNSPFSTAHAPPPQPSSAPSRSPTLPPMTFGFSPFSPPAPPNLQLHGTSPPPSQHSALHAAPPHDASVKDAQ
ncbi:hypothetical protein ACM66B_001077 [Microbotryomycetes sp. NB124-2]